VSKWPRRRIGDLIAPIESVDPTKAPDETFRYIDVSSVSSASLEIVGVQRVVGREAPSRARRRVRTGDVLYATIRPTLKRIAVVPPDLDGAVCSTGYLVLRSAAEIDHRYLFYVLQSPEFSTAMELLQRGASYPAVSDGDIRNQEIPLPSLDEQKRIVAKLDEISSSLAALTEIELKMSQEESALRAAWLETLMRPDDTWSDACLGHIADIFDGPHATPKKVEEGPWYLSIASLSDGDVDLQKSAHISPEDFAEWTRRTQVSKGDTLFSYETRLGQAGFWSHSDPAALGRRMGLLRPKPNVVPRFLTLLYLSPFFQREVVKRTSRGATVDRIPIKDMGEWPVRIPPLERQQTIVEAFDDAKRLHTRLTFLVARRHELVDKLRHAWLTACVGGGQ
jgi:type I restriction enzyme, S subunit